LKIRKISLTYVPDVLINFVQVKDEKHKAGFEIAQLENEIDPGLNGVQLIKHRFFFRRKGKVLNAFFVREAGTPVECLYLVTFKHGETLAWILHVTGNDRLGTTAIYLNLIDMHVVDEYTQKW
jgi:hypothetical protein